VLFRRTWDDLENKKAHRKAHSIMRELYAGARGKVVEMEGGRKSA